MRHGGRLGSLLVIATLAATTMAPTTAGASSVKLSSRLLSLGELPLGWKSAPTSSSYESTSAPCLTGRVHEKSLTHASVAFTQGPAVPSFSESLARGANLQKFWTQIIGAMAQCPTASLTIGSVKHKIAIEKIPFTKVGTASSAYLWSFNASGIHFGVYLVMVEVDSVVATFTYADIGTPLPATVEAFVDAGLSKLSGGAGRVTGVVAVASAPVQIAHTDRGAVGYRILGRGPALMLIMGYAGDMATWDPRFVDALAEHFRVVVFDNAGIGDTASLPRPLTIDAMAGQTSALIDSLGLKKVDVLGWSMGGMIAQALAVLHPSQVHRLVLCASFPGRGEVVRPAQVVIDSLTDSSLPQAKTVLFPASKTAALDAFLLAISRYPAHRSAGAATIKAQGSAVTTWWSGDDTAGRRIATISVPTLVADGAKDNIDPVVNDYALATLIPRGQLAIYGDAGHAFLFQKWVAFVPRVEAFLG